MRAQRSGLVVTISSTAGIRGGEFLTAYAASKFGVEGWMESLTPEVAPFGIRTMLVEPGFFRTELLTPESTNYAEPTIEDYAEKTRQTVTAWSKRPSVCSPKPMPTGNCLRRSRTTTRMPDPTLGVRSPGTTERIQQRSS